MTSKPFPPPKGMASFWRSRPGHLDDHRTTNVLPTECDILIVGAGYSGASLLTHFLSQDESVKKTFLVLEARQLCSGATGRNGGHLKPDFYNLCSSIAEKHGVEAASEIAAFEKANVHAVSTYIRNLDVDCDFVLTRAIDVQLSETHNAALKRRYDGFIAAGGKIAKEATYVEGEDAERFSGVKGAKGAYHYTAGHVWPYKLMHHMFAEALEHPNVNIQANTPVVSIADSPRPDGRWKAVTPRGTVVARQVIMATNAYTPALLPEYRDKIIPYRAVCSRIITPDSSKPPPLTNTYALRFSDWDFDYLIPRPDGSIVVGGARRTYLRHLDDWYGSVDDTQVIARAREYFDGYMQRHFQGWENSNACTDAVWTGIMGYSADRLPRIGKIPGRENMFIMAGFTGHGMPQIFLAAKELSQMVSKGMNYSDSGLPRLFEESRARLESKENFLMDLYNSIPPCSRL